MNRIVLLCILLLSAFSGFAEHLKGGFFTYSFVSKTANTITYRVTLNVYMDCEAFGQQIDKEVNFTIYETNTNRFIRTTTVSKTSEYKLSKTADEQCITGNQAECYYKIVVYNLGSLTLPISADGYTISYQRCCRIKGINNIKNSQDIGNTYSITIPGTNIGQGAETNNSARFLINDTIVVCGASEFQYPFIAE